MCVGACRRVKRLQPTPLSQAAHTTITGSPHHYYRQPTPLLQCRRVKRPQRMDRCADMCVDMRIDISTGTGFEACLSALSRRHRRHAHCAGMVVPVLKMSASPLILCTGPSIPAQWACRRRCRDRADIEPIYGTTAGMPHLYRHGFRNAFVRGHECNILVMAY